MKEEDMRSQEPASVSAATPPEKTADKYKALPLTMVEFFGDAVESYRVALNAAHAFAQASGCEPGHDVFDWLRKRADAFTQEQFARRPPFVQAQNPVTRRWAKLDTRTGRIVATKRSAGPWKNLPRVRDDA
jgi:hypothetical protein